MARFLKSCSLFFVFVLPATVVSSQEADLVDAYVNEAMAKQGIPGVALAVVKGGETVKIGAYGLANVELKVPVSAESVFELSSVTKPFTATAIMMLVEEGKVRLDEPIGTYISGAPDTWADVTVRHLLSHTIAMSPAVRERNDGSDYTTAEMFEGIREWPLNFVPGDRWQYFDLGYFLLGMIIEEQSGWSYRDFLRERMFEPLGMTSTRIIDQWEIVEDRVAGYTVRDGKLAHIRRTTQIELPSHFGVMSTAVDLARWDVALSSGGLVSRTSLEQMWTPVQLNDGSTYPFGLGWLLMDHRGHPRALHSGGSGTNLTRFPEQDLTVIVLTNLGHVADFAWHLAQGIAGLHDPVLLPPDMLSVRQDPDPERTRRLEVFLRQVAVRDDMGEATPHLRAILPRDGRFRAGSFRGLEVLEYLACDQVPVGKLERLGASVRSVCHYRVSADAGVFYVSFWLTAEGMVADFLPYRDFVGDGVTW